MGAHYAGMWILFTGLFVIAMAAYYFSKWHIKGPGIKAKWKKIWKTITFQNEKKAASVKRGKVVTSVDFEKEIEAARQAATSGQELLQAEVKVDDLERAKREAQSKIDEKEKAKLDKVNKKRSKKGLAEIKLEEENKTSLFDDLGSEELGAGNTAQDLLYQDELKEEIEHDIADVRQAMYDAGESIEEVIEEVVVEDVPNENSTISGDFMGDIAEVYSEELASNTDNKEEEK